MTDARSTAPDQWWRGPLAASTAAAAAAEQRQQAAARQLAELQQRLERIRAGKASSREDVVRATLAAEAQRRGFIQAQRRAFIRAQRRLAAIRPGSGRTGRSEWNDQQQAARVKDSELYRRLCAAFVSLANSHPRDRESLSDQDRRRHLTTALVEQASGPTRKWTEALCQLAVAVIPGVTGSAISTFDQLGVAHPVAANDDHSLELEQLQQVVGEGPGYDARVGGLPLVVENLARSERRWPGYVGSLPDQRIGVVWSFPVSVEGTVLASLTLYHHRGATPENLAWRDAMMLSRLAEPAMIIDSDLAADHGPTPSHPPDQVELASGVLAGRSGVSVDQALTLLRGHAFSTGRRISEVAADVLAGLVDLH